MPNQKSLTKAYKKPPTYWPSSTLNEKVKKKDSIFPIWGRYWTCKTSFWARNFIES
jgi:hypothetical protein